MQKLSTGQDANLGHYRKLAAAVFGKESKAVAFLDGKIAESPQGDQEPVLADESQMVMLLTQIDQR